MASCRAKCPAAGGVTTGESVSGCSLYVKLQPTLEKALWACGLQTRPAGSNRACIAWAQCLCPDGNRVRKNHVYGFTSVALIIPPLIRLMDEQV